MRIPTQRIPGHCIVKGKRGRQFGNGLRGNWSFPGEKYIDCVARASKRTGYGEADVSWRSHAQLSSNTIAELFERGMVAVGEVIDAGPISGCWDYVCHIGSHDHTFARGAASDVHVISSLNAADHRTQVAGGVGTRNQWEAKNGERHFILLTPRQQNILRLDLANTVRIARGERVVFRYILSSRQPIDGNRADKHDGIRKQARLLESL